jgi:hypothetical protein
LPVAKVKLPDRNRDSALRLVACALLSALVACAGSAPSSPGQETDTFAPEPDKSFRLADIGKACTPESPATVLDGARLDSLSADSRARRGYADEIWVTLARTVPGGVGGVFVDKGVGYLWLVDPAKRSEAIAALSATSFGASLQQANFPLQNVVVLKARWDFAQLADWYAYVLPRAVFGVRWSFADIQEARNRLEFGVVDETARVDLERRLQALDLPCNLIAIQIRPPAVAL